MTELLGGKRHMLPGSRSIVRDKTDAIMLLVLRVRLEEGNSREADAALLREAARLCQSAAYDLDPHEDGEQ